MSPRLSRPDSPLFIGVDRGGTWTRIVALDHRKRQVFWRQHPTLPLRQLPSQLQKQLRGWRIRRPAGLAVASRGVWAASKKRSLENSLKTITRNVIVLSDVEAAWFAAFGNGKASSRAQIVLIAGTGSIALTKNAKGHWKRTGGLGPEKGDEGSAFWIGKKWLQLHPSRRKRLSVSDTAPLARQVIRKAESGNPEAQTILNVAYHHLLELVGPLSRPGGNQVYLHGGLFSFDFFRRGFLRAARRLPGKYTWIRPRVTAEMAAVLHIMAYGAP